MFICLIPAIGTKYSLAKGLGTQCRDVSENEGFHFMVLSVRGSRAVKPRRGCCSRILGHVPRLTYSYKPCLMYARIGARRRACRLTRTNQRSWSFMSPRMSTPNELDAEPLVAAVSKPVSRPHRSTSGTTFPARYPLIRG